MIAKHSNSLANQALYYSKEHYKDTWEFIKFWKLVNADINGSANILKKWLQALKVSTESMEHILTWVCRGFVSNPVILKLKDNFLSPSFSYETTT